MINSNELWFNLIKIEYNFYEINLLTGVTTPVVSYSISNRIVLFIIPKHIYIFYYFYKNFIFSL